MTTYTPPQIAKSMQVSRDKVITWITSGDLLAFDVASKGSLRPRYRVTADALAEFQRHRAVKTVTRHKPTPRVLVGANEKFI